MDPTRLVFRNAVSRYLRARVSGLRVLASALAETTPSQRPEHGGLLASTGAENHAWEDEDTAARRRRRELLAAIAAHLRLPRDVEIDIEIETRPEGIAFRVRDVESGNNLHTLDEPEARGIVEGLRTSHGHLVDFSV